jgi:hypothetical protein
MKKIIASLVTAGFALVSVQAFAQVPAPNVVGAAVTAAASAAMPAATSALKPNQAQALGHAQKSVEHFGKLASSAQAAAAAATDDKGAAK